jgi:GNAT superfamily N-acetyltransferase
VRIRPAGSGDLPALAALMAASPLLERYGTSRRAARDALARGRAAGDRLIVAALPGAPPAGLAWVMPSRILTGAAYLRLLLVDEPHQRAGTGAALLKAAEAAARTVANHVVLLVTADNAGARRFYEQHGYRHVGCLPGLARATLDEALYWKTLRAHGRRLPV